MTAPSIQTILVVDHDPTARSAVEECFRSRGYVVRGVGNVPEAMSVIGSTSVDVVLSEIHLPGMEGHAILRQLGLRVEHPPVVVVTASTELEDAIEALRRRAFDYLVKPVPMERLLDVVDRAVLVGPVPGGSARGVHRAWAAQGAAGGGGGEANADVHGSGTAGSGGSGGGYGGTEPGAGGRAGSFVGSSSSTTSAVARVVEALRTGRMTLPAADPRIGELQQLLGNVDAGGAEVLQIVGRDGALTTAVLKAANAAAAGSSRRIMNLREACVRLGNRSVYTVLLEVLLSRSLTVRKEPFMRMLALSWKNAALTARIAEHLAGALHLPAPEEILAPALLHNVGEQVLLHAMADPALGVAATSADTLAGLAADVAAAHESVGALALRTWGLPSDVVRLAESHHQPAPGESDETRRVREVVVASWALARLGGAEYLPDGRTDMADLIRVLGLGEVEIARALAAGKSTLRER